MTRERLYHLCSLLATTSQPILESESELRQVVDDALAEERDRIRALLDAKHVDYWDAFDEPAA